MNVCITGASGFVGRNVLKQNTEQDYLIIQRDELERVSPSRLNGSEAVLHLAGKAHDLRSVSDPQEYYHVNYELTKRLYDAFLQSDAGKFIFISSVKAAKDNVEGILDEEATPDPQTHYGKSKLMAEEYIRSQPLPEGKAYYILRPCMIHGPGNKGNLNLLYRLVRNGIPYPLGAFDNRRSYLGITNLCFVLREIVSKRDLPSGVYNIADDNALSTREVVRLISESLKRRSGQYTINKQFIHWVARMADRLHLPFGTERLNKLTSDYIVSNEKIKKTLNIGLPLSTSEGLLYTFNSFNKNG